MRFAFVGYSYGMDPRLIGGHQSCLRRLAHYLSARGIEVDYLVFGEARAGPQPLEAGGRVHYMPSFADVADHLQRTRYDYVQLSYIPIRYYPEAIRYLARRPSEVRHGYFYVVYPPTPLMRWVRLTFFKLFYDIVVAVSPRLHRHVARYRIPSLLWLPPVPDSFFEPVARDAGVIRLAYIGRVDADKGVQHVIRLFHRLHCERADVRPHIYGYYYPHSADSLRLHHELKRQQRITYHGGSYQDYTPAVERELLNRLQSTDLLILPYERLAGITVDVPVLLVEAMATGCALITTQVADLPHIVGDPDLCVANPDDMHAAVNRLLDRDAIRAKGRALRERALALGVALSQAGAAFLRGIGFG